MKASVIICTLNRAPYLRRALVSLKYQTFKDFEVIVVNGPSEDDTASVLDEFREDIKIGRCDVPNLSVSRNMGICMSQGDIVAFIDDDCVPEPEWLDAIVAGYHDDEVGAVGGPVYGPDGVDLQYTYHVCDRFGEPTYFDCPVSEVYSIPFADRFAGLQGGNCSCRRRLLLELGGFDEEYDYFLDETDLCCRIVDAGYRIRQMERAFVHHKHAPSAVRSADGTLVNRYPTIKNKAYFCVRATRNNGRDSMIRTLGVILDFIEDHRLDVHCQRSAGRLTESEADRFLRDADRALTHGLRSGLTEPRKLLQPARVTVLCAPFKKFKTLLYNERPLVICFPVSHCEPESDLSAAHFDLALAEGLAADGHHVHIIVPSTSEKRVDFRNGTWVHHVSATTGVKSLLREHRWIPRDIWTSAWVVREEILRVDSHHSVDVIQSSLQDMLGIACLTEDRFASFVSLASTDATRPLQRYDGRKVSPSQPPAAVELSRIQSYCLQRAHGLLVPSEPLWGNTLGNSLCLKSLADEGRVLPVERSLFDPSGHLDKKTTRSVVDFYTRVLREVAQNSDPHTSWPLSGFTV